MQTLVQTWFFADGSEHRLDSNTQFKRQLQFETRRPQIILRYVEREENRDYINVYPGSLSYAIHFIIVSFWICLWYRCFSLIYSEYADISVPSIQVSITPETSANDVLVLSLHRLGVGVSKIWRYGATNHPLKFNGNWIFLIVPGC